MKQTLVYCLSVRSVASIANLVLIGTVAGLSLGMAQISLCPESASGSRSVRSACAGRLDPFDVTLPPPQPQYPSPFNLTIAPEKPQHRDGDSQTVTLEQLSHAVPKKAQKERENAQKAMERNQPEEAVGHLKAAIQIDPGFVRARNDLAVLYIWMGKPGPAIEQLNEATKLDPHFPVLFINLTVGYIVGENFADAERAARVAFDLNRTGRLPQYLLAAALYYQNKFTEEALRCAEQTSDTYPLAHLFAARVFIDRRDFERARGEIRTYLSGKNRPAAYASTANDWLDFIAAHE